MQIFNTEKQWQDVLEQSKTETVIVLKHSNTCPISSKGYEEIESFSKENPGASVFVLIVQDAPGLKIQISDETGVKHESPQVLIIKDASVVYTASHYEISSDKLATEYTKALQ